MPQWKVRLATKVVYLITESIIFGGFSIQGFTFYHVIAIFN